MVSPVDVANMALDNIGARFSITSLSPPLPAPNAVTVARHFQSKIDALHRAAHWNCTRRQGNITLTRAAAGTPENPTGALTSPPVPYQYEYLYPADCLLARYLVPNPPGMDAVSPPIMAAGYVATPWYSPDVGYPFAVGISTDPVSGAQIKVIWTNLEYAQLVYTARILDPDLWDPHFLIAATATLGAWLVNPLARNAEVLKEQIQIASSVITQARISDGNEGTTSIDHVPDWMAVRGITGLDYGRTCYYGWSSMGFPGGGFI